MNENELSQAARLLGSKKSERKANAARENGRLGGRPRKHKGNAHDRRKARRAQSNPRQSGVVEARTAVNQSTTHKDQTP